MKAQLLLLIVVVFAVALCVFSKYKTDGYSYTKKVSDVLPRKADTDGMFDNSEYQYGNPSQWREQYYRDCIVKECKGNTHDYNCLEKCHLKSFRVDMGDQKDHAYWVCYNYRNDEDAYYRCLDAVYADYKYP